MKCTAVPGPGAVVSGDSSKDQKKQTNHLAHSGQSSAELLTQYIS